MSTYTQYIPTSIGGFVLVKQITPGNIHLARQEVTKLKLIYPKDRFKIRRNLSIVSVYEKVV